MSDARLTDEAIICFGADWGRHPTSTQKLVEGIAQHSKLLWVNSLGGRRVKFSRTDLSRVVAKVRGWLKGVRRTRENWFVLTPIVLPFHRFRVVRLLNFSILYLTVRYLMKQLGLEKPVLIVSYPQAVYLVGRLREKVSVYYCSDEFSEFPDVEAEVMRRIERELLKRVDLVMVTSETLRESKSVYHPNVSVVRHGVDFEHFRRALDCCDSLPGDISRIPQPVIGFYGLLDEWIDFELIEYLARNHPDWSLVLIGEVISGPDPDRTFPNLYFLGPRPYDRLPSYSRAFRVAIIPFKVTPLTVHVNPLKLLEYLAAGRPVVSTDLPECRRFGRLVEVAASNVEFERAVEKMLRSDDPEHVSRRVAVASSETWESKVAKAAAIISGAIANRNDPPAAGLSL